MKPIKAHAFSCEIFILAGGLSSRMGRDKNRLRLGNRTLLQHVRDTARQLHFPVRVIRRDAVPRCGPLGGIYTALQRSRAEAVMILACDMPFISASFLRGMVKAFKPVRTPRKPGVRAATLRQRPIAVFAREDDRAGFPCILRREPALQIVGSQITRSELSLQNLARILRAKTLRPGRTSGGELTNINTPADWEKSRRKEHNN